MKKMFLLMLLALFITFTGFAQKYDTAKIIKKLPDTARFGTLSYTINDVEVFEQANYQGRSGYYKWQNGKIVPPFKTTTGSIRVAAGKIVYFKKCDTEFPYELAYDASQAKFDLRNICGVRSDDASGFTILFNGISTIIHNNDCKRVFGTITVKVIENAPDGGSQANMRLVSAGTRFRRDAFTFLPFSNANANTTPPYSNYVHNASPSVPTITTTVAGSGGVGESLGGFRVGASALRDGRVTVIVTSNIASAHKTCDLCDDFSSNVHMAAPVNAALPLNKTYGSGQIINAANSRVVLGPYRASGTRDGSAITASGGTFIDFRAHFTFTGL
ncbi:MAG: hypothetical protein JNM88_14530 [Chitinophagaceae bacterium]|nr:hypothetical protein [Chitinophagaceae bacterium]